MNARLLFITSVVVPLLLAGCRGCDGRTNSLKPMLAVSPTQIDFGRVKAGSGMGEAVVKLTSESRTSVSISSISVEDGPIAGTSAAYKIVDAPESVPTLGNATFTVQFAPTELQAYDATLVVASNDPDHPRIEIPLTGEGAHPVMSVVPECNDALFCKGTVVLDPPSIDFGKEPIARSVPTPVTELPKVNVINESEVPLQVTHIGIEGTDATAFTLEGGGAIPTDGMTLDATEGVNLSIRFKPLSEQQVSYSAELVIRGDDPDHPEVRVALTGQLGPNLPPVVCANIIKVKPGFGGAQRLYDSATDWAPLLTPPPGGYDFSGTRDIDPKAVITFSAQSSTDDRTCTTDPEDRRSGLTYQWEMTKWPTGGQKLKLTGDTTPTATVSPVAFGDYEVTLTVKDAQGAAGAPGHTTAVPIRFSVVLKQDLVVQLSWNGENKAFANTDLDVHLVRPGSQPFSFFDEPNGGGKTSGDINGVSSKYYKDNGASGINFDWGGPGVADNPTLNLDDQGGGDLIENVSLNFPEHDPACATESCRYGLYVHYFEDRRGSSGANCTVDSTCKDGDPCNCTALGERCVAAVADTSAATGTGKCYLAPEPVVTIFFRGNPTPAAVIPLDTLTPPDDLRIGAPCQMLHVADIIWPAQSTIPTDGGMGPPPTVEVVGADGMGRITAPEITRYGVRSAGSLACSGNDSRAGGINNWYSLEPR